MSVHYINGNILDSDCQFICHQVNCQGRMNSGVAKAIRDKWPKVFAEYRAKYSQAKDLAVNNKYENYDPSQYLLGNIQIIALYEDYSKIENHQYVINMFAQETYGYDGRRYTSYDAFWICLGNILRRVDKGSTIAFPDHIGCCRGGANWGVIETMIEEVLGEDYEVYIYKLEEN